MKKMLAMLGSVLSMWSLSASVWAQTYPVSDNDQSKKIFIDTLFGPLVGGGGSEFSGVIGIFNSAMLLLGGVMVAYTLIAGTMSTAHDGEMLGKRWSSLWVPIRTAVGAAMIFPLGSGFCALQYIVMWIAMQGVGFADALVERFVTQTFSPSSFTPPSNYGARRQLLEKWLVAASCDKAMSAYQTIANATTASGLGIGGLTNGASTSSYVDGGRQYIYGGGMCGNVYIANVSNETFAMDDNFASFDAEQFADALFNANVSQMESAKSQVESLAEKISNGSDDNEALKQEVASTLDQLARTWDDTVKQTARSSYQGAVDAENGARYRQQVVDDGWLTFGGWYMEVARVQDTLAKAVSTVPSVSSNAYERVMEQERSTGVTGFFTNLFKNNLFDVETRSAIKRAHAMAGYTSGGVGGSNALNDNAEVTNPSSMLVKWFITPDYKSMFDENQDFGQNPVIMAQNLGRNMVGWGTAGYVTGVAAILLLDRDILGNTIARLGVISPMITAVAGTILVTGAFLSVYPPMLPYVLWIGAVLGWVIFLVEAIIAAPLWAVAQIAPDGDGVVGKGGQGYMLVLSLFMRPALMVLGFIAAVIVMKPMGFLINSTFLGAFLSGASPSWYGIVTAIMGCILYATLMVSVINKVFALIHVIPDKILRWMGGGGDSDLGSAAQGVEGTTLQKTVAGAHVASSLGQAGVGGAQNLRGIIENDRNHARGQRQQAFQSDQQQTDQHRGEINASNEEADDALRGMGGMQDTSEAGDRFFDAQANKATEALDKNSVHSLKGAIASANSARSGLVAKGRNATDKDRAEAAQAESFLSSVGNINPSDPGQARSFMAANAGAHSGTSWGNIMARSNKQNATIQNSMQSLRDIRTNAKEAKADESDDKSGQTPPDEI